MKIIVESGLPRELHSRLVSGKKIVEPLGSDTRKSTDADACNRFLANKMICRNLILPLPVQDDMPKFNPNSPCRSSAVCFFSFSKYKLWFQIVVLEYLLSIYNCINLRKKVEFCSVTQTSYCYTCTFYQLRAGRSPSASGYFQSVLLEFSSLHSLFATHSWRHRKFVY